MSGAICDRMIVARGKGNVYKMIVKPTMMYGLEMSSLTKRERAELKVLTFSLGATTMDKIRKRDSSG